MNLLVLHGFALMALAIPLGGATVGDIASSTCQAKGPSSGLVQEATAAELRLGYWVGCPIQDEQRVEQLSVKLCRPVSAGIGDDTYNFVRGTLRQGRNDPTTLCAVDSAVVRSLEQCPSLRQDEEVATTTYLVLDLADAWRQQGVYERAGQLYRHVNLLLEGSRGHNLQKMKALGAWAMFELQHGEAEHARELADRYVQLARERHQTGATPSRLIKGLELQASVLRKLGRTAEAQTAEEEAKRLAAVSRNCDDDLCVSERFRVVCKGNAAGELVCVREQ